MKLVMVEWVDSTFCQGWHDRDYTKEHEPSRITSAGILIYKDDNRMTIVQSVSDRHDAGDGITIPMCAVTRIRELKASGKEKAPNNEG